MPGADRLDPEESAKRVVKAAYGRMDAVCIVGAANGGCRSGSSMFRRFPVSCGFRGGRIWVIGCRTADGSDSRAYDPSSPVERDAAFHQDHGAEPRGAPPACWSGV